VSAAAHRANETTNTGIALPAEILRFRTSERHLHWAIAAPFIVCYATAMVLVSVYNPDPTRPFRAVFSCSHRLSGVCLFLLPLLTVLRYRHDFQLHLRNIRAAWGWRVEDVKWLYLIGLSTFNKRVLLPDQGKFNAGEKLNFMFLSASYPLYIITGFLIWLPGVAFASWILHLSMAALATPLIFGHLFMALVNPDTRVGLKGMISGYVDRHWAQHHYRLWYNEHFWHLHKPPEQKPKPLPVAAAIATDKPVRTEAAATVAAAAAKNDTKPFYNNTLPASIWPPMMRPAPVNQAAPETT
jgi:formate dehydrogenase subunit gamma